MGLEGLVSKHCDRPYCGGRQKHWIKVKNRSHPAMEPGVMTDDGKPSGWQPRTERDHFIRCPICGKMLDMRDLGEVISHLHGQEIEEEPTVH
ncbi:MULTISPECIES: hypothetical protein [unclassified Bradyrhizobium]|uniref:hypothetical protein n=1 Tax=unclassified Bradyrhizobium TaxID=2631580 RepID=UPI001FFBBA1E|nr:MULTISPECIES: hypothetical protein [unclassified Bradyrhizobium]